ncbi:serine hydrolase [Pedococcus sp. KACC 23699]|uniref:Serine hydrolase n=1 Tax=Pedococcus sp. KACC 23699 TaxID=3149228 RepID=A0AAU7JTV2_9MICO
MSSRARPPTSHVAPGRARPGWLMSGGTAALAALLLVGGCSGTATPTPSDRAPTRPASSFPGRPVTPDPDKITSATRTYLTNIYSPAISNVRAVLVTVDHRALVQLYRSSTPARAHDVHSVTKSVIATLVGIALSEGRLHSLDDTLATLLPQHAAEMNSTVRAITLRQLLTMTAGLPPDQANGNAPASMSGADWVGNILRTGTVAPPGRSFAYSSAGSHLLSAILTRATGMSALDYARSRLFGPLGIDSRHAVEPRTEDKGAIAAYDKADFAWPKDPRGIQLGFAALKMSPRDMAKLGQLYLDGGRWNGRQVVPAQWVKASTTAQVGTRGDRAALAESYGYQWWVTQERGHHAFAAFGFGGQVVEVVPDLRLVVVVATEAIEPNLRWEHVRGMIADAIVPAVGG